MATQGADAVPARPRPRPTTQDGQQPARPGRAPARRQKVSALALPEPPQGGQVVVVAAAGTAILTAARVGRLLGRSGWRIARQLPGMSGVEARAQRLRETAAAEMSRLLDTPAHLFGSASPEEQRAMLLVQGAGADPEPLRTAMTELLERSSEPDADQSRDYLFGTIVSQLVPDEARILATLAGGHSFAAIDVVARHVVRGATREVLANASTVGAAAGVSLPANTPTYVTRLHGFGLIAFDQPGAEFDEQFDILGDDPAVQAARHGVDDAKQGSARIVRKAVSLSAFGAQLWAACAPTRSAIERR